MSRLPTVRVAGTRPLAPRESAFTVTFWAALRRHRLLGTRCDACAAVSFPPRNLCRRCWSESVQWVPLAGRGRLYSYTRVHVAPATMRAEAPYCIGIVDLDDGVRLMCRLLGSPEPADLEQPVEMVVLLYDDGPLFAARRATPI